MKNKQEEICEWCGKTEEEHFKRNVRDPQYKAISEKLYCTKYGVVQFKPVHSSKDASTHKDEGIEKSIIGHPADTSKKEVYNKDFYGDGKMEEENMFLQIGQDCKFCGVKGVCHEMLAYHRMGKCMEKPLEEETLSSKEMMIFNERGFYTRDVKEFIKRRVERIKLIIQLYPHKHREELAGQLIEDLLIDAGEDLKGGK